MKETHQRAIGVGAIAFIVFVVAWIYHSQRSVSQYRAQVMPIANNISKDINNFDLYRNQFSSKRISAIAFESELQFIISDLDSVNDKIKSIQVPASMNYAQKQLIQASTDLENAFMYYESYMQQRNSSATAQGNQFIIQSTNEFQTFKQMTGIQ